MRILWVTNTIFPAASRAIGRPEPVIGGWMYGLAERIAQIPSINLAVATVYTGRELRILEFSGIRYFLLPTRAVRRYQAGLEPMWAHVCESFAPDLIHIHGTENPHGLACIRAWRNIPYVVSVQGLTSINMRYHFGGISQGTHLRHITFRDLVRGDSVFHTMRQRKRCAKYECEVLRAAAIVVGRTDWDRAHVKVIAAAANYASCNESLREPFYSAEKWNLSASRRHTIFMSQGHTPMKGLHQVLRAMALLRRDIPDLTLRIAGHNIVASKPIKRRFLRTGYGSYVATLIRHLRLERVVDFIGLTGPERMVTEYRNAHVYVCPSAIENSPNSVGEAQIIGVPVIAADVGGIPDFVCHGRTGLLYRFEEEEVLADRIRRLMTDDSLAAQISANQIEAATERHNPVVNHQNMVQIYERACRNRA